MISLREIDFQKVESLFLYDPENPLLFNSGFFLLFFTVFLFIYALIYNRVKVRSVVIVLFSAYFYYKSSGMYLFLLMGATVISHYLSKWIYVTREKMNRKILLIVSLTFYLALLCYFKYTNFFVDTLNAITGSEFNLLSLVLPLGISFFTFELISYSVDVYQNKIKPASSLLDFGFYISFFPHLVAGPIVRPNEFLPQINSTLKISTEDIGKGVFLIISGLFKKAIISDYISSNFVDRVFDNPALYSGIENLLGVYGYTLQIYCDFSGYSDMAIGIALLIGFKLPLNFNSPYQSTSITDFWRRWHISLSSWLRDYLYIPLGGNKVGKFRQYINLMITMLLGGLWHGASWKFIFWGGMHGLALSADKMLKSFVKIPESAFFKIAGWIITFHFVAFCWIFFRADSFSTATVLLNQIATNLKPQLFLDVVIGYKQVFILIFLGYVLHFLPQQIDKATEKTIIRIPAFSKALVLAFVIWMVIQFKSADVQPFIYFQF